MRQFDRLRRRLGAALIAGAALSGCGPAAVAGRPAGGGAAVIAIDAGVEIEPRETVMRTPPAQCSGGGKWCGPAEAARRFADGLERRLGCPPSARDGTATFALDDKATEKVRAEGMTGACCYDFTAYCRKDEWIEGRPLLHGGEAMLAPVPGARAAGAVPWLEEARAEHASILSFARAARELAAVGAPAVLIEGCLRAALDEVRHAASAFALASRFAGRPLAPGRLECPPDRAPDLRRVAVDTFLEGGVAETLAVMRAMQQLERAVDPAVRAHLEMVVRDESRHAELAWMTIGWTVAAGGEPVRRALREAARRRGVVGTGLEGLVAGV